MKKLGEVFNPYLLDSKLPDEISGGLLEKLNINSKTRSISLSVHFERLISRDTLFSAEKQIAMSTLTLGSVRIHPVFDSSLFNAEYFPELYKAIKREIPSIHGTLNNAFVDYDGKNIRISLNNGGKSLLDAKGFDKAFTKLVNDEFGIHVGVVYDGTLEVEAESEEYIQSIKNAEEKIHREAIQKAEEFYKDDTSIQDAVREKRISDATSEIEIREGDYLRPQIIESTIRPLYGRTIKG